uniref:C2H2-type domain-containing protein n=1 Tax=Romanomermis culicivorax TaxID=13658 RepID=A0A915KTC7_ROMCU
MSAGTSTIKKKFCCTIFSTQFSHKSSFRRHRLKQHPGSLDFLLDEEVAALGSRLVDAESKIACCSNQQQFPSSQWIIPNKVTAVVVDNIAAATILIPAFLFSSAQGFRWHIQQTQLTLYIGSMTYAKKANFDGRRGSLGQLVARLTTEQRPDHPKIFLWSMRKKMLKRERTASSGRF